MVMANYSPAPLFESSKAKGSLAYKLFATSIFTGIISILVYRATHFSQINNGSFVWIGMFAAEIWFGFYWILTLAVRWNRVYRTTFKNRLNQRYGSDLPGVEVFVCTADPTMEPPMMVINTVLSVMAYDYPPEKLAVYLSDDGGSDLTFYALSEASVFARHWIPFCKKFQVEPRSPEAYFRSQANELEATQDQAQHAAAVKELYKDMEKRIEVAVELGRIPQAAVSEHRGFSNWDSFRSKRDHDTILKILIEGDAETDIEGSRMPTLVYLAREKRPQHPHNFKAGAMNALIRVSSEISNAPIILNVDCDMYSNNSQSIRDALCIFLDEERGHEVAYVQFPQSFFNLTKNELYGGSLRVVADVELHGTDGHGGPLYIGTGCFHRRDTLCGRKFAKGSRFEWKEVGVTRTRESVVELEERVKALASSTFEKNTQWGHEIGLKYGCPVEDVITGLSIHQQGWKSVYFNPERKGFLGLAPTTLDQTLVQQKRWSEGDLQIFLSKYSPIFALGKIKLGHIMAYCVYCLWAVNCFATLYYSIIPSLCLLKGIALFPKMSSQWIIPFMYVIVAQYVYSFAEYLWTGGTSLGWWNERRMWLYKRTSSYLFAVMDTFLMMVGDTDSGFAISAKVSDEDVLERYEQEIMEFGGDSPMFTILSSLALLNLISFVLVVTRVVFEAGGLDSAVENYAFQIALCGALVLINLPLYNAAFLRKDKGKLPSSVTLKSTLLALSFCTFSYLL